MKIGLSKIQQMNIVEYWRVVLLLNLPANAMICREVSSLCEHVSYGGQSRFSLFVFFYCHSTMAWNRAVNVFAAGLIVISRTALNYLGNNGDSRSERFIGSEKVKRSKPNWAATLLASILYVYKHTKCCNNNKRLSEVIARNRTVWRTWSKKKYTHTHKRALARGHTHTHTLRIEEERPKTTKRRKEISRK